MGFELGNGEEMNAQHPRSFFIPSAEERAGLVPGDIVKLLFLPDGDDAELGGERMWVEVTETTEVGWIGRLDNDPVVIEGIRAGDPIAFAARHVISIWDDTPHPLEGTTAFVTERLFADDELGVAWLEFDPEDAGKESSHERVRSGWMLWSDDEPDTLEAEDVRICDTLWVLERWPGIEATMMAHDGSAAWYRRVDEDAYEREPDEG